MTQQLFDALGELGVVGRGQPHMLVRDHKMEPTKIPCLGKGISAGLWVDRGTPGLWLVGCSLLLLASAPGVLLVVILLLPLLFFPAGFSLTGWLLLILLFRTHFDCVWWECRVTQRVQRTASWLPAVDKSRSSKSVEVQRLWEVYDDRL